MEFTWLKTCAAKKYTFFRAHFWSPGTAYLKCICTQLYFWCFDDVYFWIFIGVFAMRFWSKNVYIIYPFGTCRAQAFLLRLGHLCLAQVYLFSTCVEIGFVFLLHMYLFTRACRTGCVFFGKRIFGLHLWEKENHIFAASVFRRHIFFPRSSVLMIVLRQLESLPGLEISTIWLYVRQIRNN